MNRKSGCQCSQGCRIQQPSSLITNHVYLHVPALAFWCLLHPEPGNPLAMDMHHIVWGFFSFFFFLSWQSVLLVSKIKFKNIFKSYWVIFYFEKTLQFYKGVSQPSCWISKQSYWVEELSFVFCMWRNKSVSDLHKVL